MKIKINHKIPIGFILVLFLSFGIDTNSDNLPVTEVVLISSMHGAHENHRTYSYDTLYSLIRYYTPDFVGVEIRPEDLEAADDYLGRNYPKEMIALLKEYKSNAFGFDWLGESIVGLPIPDDYWKNLEVKKLAKLMMDDEELLSRKPVGINVLKDKQNQILLTATPASLNDGRYGQLCREIDTLEELWLEGTGFEKIIAFDRMRDARIGNNITGFIADNPGLRIVIVLGADHRTFALEAIENKFKQQVRILPVVDSEIIGSE